MKSLITKHQRIIVFADNIEMLYTYIAMMMLLSDTIIICCLGFIIATVSNRPKMTFDYLLLRILHIQSEKSNNY